MNDSMNEPIEARRINQAAVPFVVIGIAGILAGGLLSAASAATPSYAASWAVAYLVLVVGAAQVGLGVGQAWLAVKRPTVGIIAAEAIIFNLANVAVLAGTLATLAALLDVGGGLCVIAFALFLWGSRGTGAHAKWLLCGYRVLLAVLIISTPIGLTIASMRMA